MSSNSISQHPRHGVWVPASAGTTPMLSPLTTHHPSSPRRRGPITTGRSFAPRSSNSISQHRRRGVWVPASAGTTPMLSPLATHHPSSPRTRGPITTGSSFVIDVVQQHLSTQASRRMGPCVRRDDTAGPLVAPALAGTQESQHLLTVAGVRFGAFRSVGYGYDQFGDRVAVRSGGKSADPDRRHYPEIERRCRKIRGSDLVGCCRAKPVLAGQRRRR